MDKEQRRRMVQAGLKKRQAKGWDPKPADVVAGTPKGGARFTKAQRKRYVALCEMAVASLAQEHWSDWYEAILELRDVMAAANFQAIVFQHTCKEIERYAIEASGDKSLPVGARLYLSQQRSRITNIAGQRPGLSDRGATAHDPLREIKHNGTSRPGDEPESTD